MPRFSIRQLLLATAFIAVGCFALLNASAWVAAALFCGLTLILSAAVLFAIYRDGERRAFWIGFAVLGWVYLFLCFSGFLSATSLSWHGNITALLTGALYDRVYSSEPAPSVPYATSTLTYSPYTPAGSNMPMTFTPGTAAPMTGSVTYAAVAV